MIEQFKYILKIVGLISLSMLFTACGGESDPKDKGEAGTSGESTPTAPAPPSTAVPSIEEANELLKKAAARARDKVKALSFEEFEKTVYHEPFEGGKYIVNGDTTITNKKLLQEFFETQIKAEPSQDEFTVELIVHQVGGRDAVWDSNKKTNLTYCVSNTFGANYQVIVDTMTSALNAWEAVAKVNFIHDTSQDNNCTLLNPNVVFDVRPVDVNGQYLARAFFPNQPRFARNVLIDKSAFQLDPNGKLQLVGILRHELGHTLGFRHEHTRPESGTCFEDNDWRPLNDYDPFSVMHYPQCNGKGDWSLTLTAKDNNGSACLYGPAPGFNIDPSLCLEPPDGTTPCPGTPKTQKFDNQGIAKGDTKQYGPFNVTQGSIFVATMTGDSGDADLYVRFGAKPLKVEYDCRPYLLDSNEECSLDVPQGKTKAYVMVNGYSAATFNLSVTHTEPASQ